MKKKKTSKRQAILKEKTQIQMLYCESTEIPITEDFETLGMTVTLGTRGFSRPPS